MWKFWHSGIDNNSIFIILLIIFCREPGLFSLISTLESSRLYENQVRYTVFTPEPWHNISYTVEPLYMAWKLSIIKRLRRRLSPPFLSVLHFYMQDPVYSSQVSTGHHPPVCFLLQWQNDTYFQLCASCERVKKVKNDEKSIITRTNLLAKIICFQPEVSVLF